MEVRFQSRGRFENGLLFMHKLFLLKKEQNAMPAVFPLSRENAEKDILKMGEIFIKISPIF